METVHLIIGIVAVLLCGLSAYNYQKWLNELLDEHERLANCLLSIQKCFNELVDKYEQFENLQTELEEETLTRDDALVVLHNMQKWRRGGGNVPHTAKLYGKAIDTAIREMRKAKREEKEWNNENPVPETQENSERNIEMNENEEFISHCPFCGSEHWEHYGKQVRCCKCGATGPNFVTAKENVNELDDEFKHVLGCEEFVNGILLWNIRAGVLDPMHCSPLHPFTHPEWERKHNAETEDGTTAGQITRVANDLRDTLIRKNHDYGNSALQPGILCPDCDATTLIRARMSDKINRLSSLVSGKQAEVKESLEDTVKDLAGYCVLWLIAMGE